MTRDRSPDDRIRAWLLDEAPGQLPDWVLESTFAETRGSRQRRRRLGWRNRPMLSRTSQLALVGAAAAVALAGAVILGPGSRPAPTAAPPTGPAPTAVAQATPTTSRSVTGQIAFDRMVDGNTDLYLMNLDGSGLQRLTSDPDEDWQPAWTPDGKVLLYTRRIGPESANESDLYALEVASGKLTRLTSSPGAEADPKVSPDGTRIAYDRWPDQAGVHVMNRDGSNDRLVHAAASESEGLIGWDSNATVLIFTSPTRVARLDMATGAVTTVVDSPLVRAEGASLSPDGRQIAFKGPTAPNGVVITDLDGTNRRYVVDAGPKGMIAWSPDAQHLLFNSQPSTSWFIVGVDGSDLFHWADGRVSAAWRPGS